MEEAGLSIGSSGEVVNVRTYDCGLCKRKLVQFNLYFLEFGTFKNLIAYSIASLYKSSIFIMPTFRAIFTF